MSVSVISEWSGLLYLYGLQFFVGTAVGVWMGRKVLGVIFGFVRGQSVPGADDHEA